MPLYKFQYVEEVTTVALVEAENEDIAYELGVELLDSQDKTKVKRSYGEHCLSRADLVPDNTKLEDVKATFEE